MARDGSGTYTRVSNTFSSPVAQTVISPTDAEAYFDDVETELTDSLSRSGKGGMSATAVLKIADGTSAAPALTFNDDTDTGLARTTANTMVAVASGVAVITFAPTGATLPSPTMTAASVPNYMDFTEIASPANSSANQLRLFAKDVGGASHLFTRDSAGTEKDMTTGSAGGDLVSTNNLSDVADVTTSRENLHAALKGHVYGLTASRDGGDTDHDIAIAVGEAASDDVSAPLLMRLTSAIVKRIDAAWAVGTNQGGIDAGSVANATWYYLWLIMRSDTGVVDVLFSTSSSAPTMPTDYDHKRLIWAVKTNGSANILAFHQIGNRYLWETPVTDISGATDGTSVATRTLASVPPLFGVIAHINARTGNAGAATRTEVASALRADGTFPVEYNVSSEAAGTNGLSEVSVHVNGSGEVKTISAVAASAISLTVTGFTFPV
jgi:hypothetical protein